LVQPSHNNCNRLRAQLKEQIFSMHFSPIPKADAH
jgi:hypothetical protein